MAEPWTIGGPTQKPIERTEEEQAALDEEMAGYSVGGADYSGDADWSMGNTYDGDYRIKLILELIAADEITLQEAENTMRWTEKSDPPEKVIGLIAGEFGASKREIASALEGTEFEMSQSDIEATTREFGTYMKQADRLAETTMKATGGMVRAPYEMLTGWLGREIKDRIGLEGSPLSEGGISFKEDSYFSHESGARREQRGAVADNIRAELERLYNNGDISRAKYNDLKSNHAGKYGYENYSTILDELRSVYEGIGDDADTGVKRGQQYVLRQLMEEREFAEDSPSNMEKGAEEVEGTTPGEDVMQDVPDSAFVDGAQDSYNFMDDLYNSGVALSQAGVDTLERARYTARDSVGRVIEADFVVDRSTASVDENGNITGGTVYSIDEWHLIKTDPAKRAEYEANKVTSPAIQEILNKPFFKDQYLQSQQNDMVGDISSEPGSYGDYWSDIDNVREWEKLQGQKSGRQQIPMEGLVPSLHVTEPWETQSYDYKVGKASADWMAMTSRERQHRQKVMKDNGLISDKEWANMGGQMYGSTGISVPMSAHPMDLQLMNIWEDAYAMSSTFQYDPIAALGVMGDAKARSAAPTRGYGSSRPKYSVPASLREVPDYKALATESRSVFRGKMGRDMEDWELALLSDELGDSYKNRNDQLIKLHRASWEDAVSGGTMEVDYSDVEDPNKSLQFDIEEDYANELDRQERVEDRSLSRNLLMDSITTGRRMIR